MLCRPRSAGDAHERNQHLVGLLKQHARIDGSHKTSLRMDALEVGELVVPARPSLEHPRDAQMLAPLIYREVTYHLLVGTHFKAVTTMSSLQYQRCCACTNRSA